MKLYFFLFLLCVTLFVTYSNITSAIIYPQWMVIVNLVAITANSLVVGSELQKRGW